VDEDPQQEAIRRWLALSDAQRREVERQARKRRRHADAAVAATAEAWAVAMLGKQTRRPFVSRLFLRALGGPADAMVSDLRLARRLLELPPPVNRV
jgi:hypothetical protein